MLAWLDITLWALAVLVGSGLLFAGAFRFVLARANRDDANRTLDLGIGAAGMAPGAVVLAWRVVLALSRGIGALVTGLLAIGVGWQMHRLAT